MHGHNLIWVHLWILEEWRRSLLSWPLMKFDSICLGTVLCCNKMKDQMFSLVLTHVYDILYWPSHWKIFYFVRIIVLLNILLVCENCLSINLKPMFYKYFFLLLFSIQRQIKRRVTDEWNIKIIKLEKQFFLT